MQCTRVVWIHGGSQSHFRSRYQDHRQVHVSQWLLSVFVQVIYTFTPGSFRCPVSWVSFSECSWSVYPLITNHNFSYLFLTHSPAVSSSDVSDVICAWYWDIFGTAVRNLLLKRSHNKQNLSNDSPKRMSYIGTSKHQITNVTEICSFCKSLHQAASQYSCGNALNSVNKLTAWKGMIIRLYWLHNNCNEQHPQ